MAPKLDIGKNRRSPSARLMLRVVLGLGVGWLACGRASEEGLESPPERAARLGDVVGMPDVGGAAGAGGIPDAGAGEASSPDCPPPGTDSPSARGPITAWGRNPETGTCCPYADLIFLPERFPFFESQQACESSCRCAELVGIDDPSTPWTSERISLECYCSDATCPTSFEAVEDERCSLGYTLLRSEGCGRRMLEIEVPAGLVNAWWVFEQSSGALVGAGDGSDAPSLPCRAYGTAAGLGLDCPDAETCRLCGEPITESIPPCD